MIVDDGVLFCFTKCKQDCNILLILLCADCGIKLFQSAPIFLKDAEFVTNTKQYSAIKLIIEKCGRGGPILPYIEG